MALQGTCRQIGEVAIVDFSGKITLGEGSATLRKTVRELADGGQQKIVLNLADVDYIDSSGIGELVSAFTTVRSAGGELKMVHLTKRVHDILQITRLFTVFDVQSDEANASAASAARQSAASPARRYEPPRFSPGRGLCPRCPSGPPLARDAGRGTPASSLSSLPLGVEPRFVRLIQNPRFMLLFVS